MLEIEDLGVTVEEYLDGLTAGIDEQHQSTS